MTRILFLLFSISIARSVCAQQEPTVVFSEEIDTLVNQRFIDRYENIFMTKVPSKHMVKVGVSQYYEMRYSPLIDDRGFNNSLLHIGYEFKFLPAFSIALSGHFPYPQGDLASSLKFTAIDAQLRWYMDMKKRIKSGKSANNFSGNYLALYYNYPGSMYNYKRLGLKAGLQRRFLNSGFMDFSFAMDDIFPEPVGSRWRWSFSSQVTLGFAFGDWKRTKIGPLCELLLCDEQIKRQWKFRFPELTLGYQLKRIRLGVAYEQKIKSSPMSFNFQFELGVNKGYNYLDYKTLVNGYGFMELNPVHSKEIFPTLSIQPRYYLFHTRQRLTGKGGNGLSGLYAGIHSEYGYFFGKQRFLWRNERSWENKKHIIKAGPLLGFQQRIFKRGYLDLNTSVHYQNQSLTSRRQVGVKANLGMGFAF